MNGGRGWTDVTAVAADEDLMDELRSLFEVAEPVDPRLVENARMAFGWRTIDTELAELCYDSLVDRHVLAGVRQDPGAGAPRLLGFGSVHGGEEFLIEIEVLPGRSGPVLTGQLVPVGSAVVRLEASGGPARTVIADEFGRFCLDRLPAGPLRLRVQRPDRTIQTAWLSYAQGA